jgi:hypothetical protein
MLNALADEQWRHPEMLNASTNNAVIPKLNAPMEGRHPDRSGFSGGGEGSRAKTRQIHSPM